MARARNGRVAILVVVVSLSATARAEPLVAEDAPPGGGRGLIVAGSLVLGLTHGLSSVAGTYVGGEVDPEALWFNLPFAGPLIWAVQMCRHNRGDPIDVCPTQVLVGGLVSAIEIGGLVMMIAGISRGRAAPADGIRVSAVLTRDLHAFVLAGRL